MSWETGFQQGPPHGTRMQGPTHGTQMQGLQPGPSHGTRMQGPPHGTTMQGPSSVPSHIYRDWAHQQGTSSSVSMSDQRVAGNPPPPPPLMRHGVRPAMAHNVNAGQPPPYPTNIPDYRRVAGSHTTGMATAVNHAPGLGTDTRTGIGQPSAGPGAGVTPGMGTGFHASGRATAASNAPELGTGIGYMGQPSAADSQPQVRRNDTFNSQPPGYPSQHPSGRMNYPSQSGSVPGRGNGYPNQPIQPRPAHMQQPSTVPTSIPMQMPRPPYSFRAPGHPVQNHPARQSQPPPQSVHRAPVDPSQNFVQSNQQSHLIQQRSTLSPNSMLQNTAAIHINFQQLKDQIARNSSQSHTSGQSPTSLYESLRRTAQALHPPAQNVAQPAVRPAAPNIPADVMSFVLGSSQEGVVPQSSVLTAGIQSQQNVPTRCPPPAHQQQQQRNVPPFRPLSPVGSRKNSNGVVEPSRDRSGRSDVRVVTQIRNAFVLPVTSPVEEEPHDKGMLGRWYAQPSTETRTNSGRGDRVNKVLPTVETSGEHPNVHMAAPDNRPSVISASNAQKTGEERPINREPDDRSLFISQPEVQNTIQSDSRPLKSSQRDVQKTVPDDRSLKSPSRNVPDREPDDRNIFISQPEIQKTVPSDRPLKSPSRAVPDREPDDRNIFISQPEVQKTVPSDRQSNTSPSKVQNRKPDDRSLFISHPESQDVVSTVVKSQSSSIDNATNANGVDQMETDDNDDLVDATEPEDPSLVDPIDMMEVICRRRIDKELTLDMAGFGDETYLTPEIGTIEQTSDKVFSPSKNLQGDEQQLSLEDKDYDLETEGYSQDIHVGIENVAGDEMDELAETSIHASAVETAPENVTLIATAVETVPDNSTLETEQTHTENENTADLPQTEQQTLGKRKATTRKPRKPRANKKGKIANTNSQEESEGQTTLAEEIAPEKPLPTKGSRKRKTREDDTTGEDEPSPKKTRGPGSRGGRGRGRGGKSSGITNTGVWQTVTSPSTPSRKSTRGGDGTRGGRRGKEKPSECVIDSTPISNPQDLMAFLNGCSPEDLNKSMLSFTQLRDVCMLFQAQAMSNEEMKNSVKQEDTAGDSSFAMDTESDLDEPVIEPAIDDVGANISQNGRPSQDYEVVSSDGRNMKMKIALKNIKNSMLNEEKTGSKGSSSKAQSADLMDEDIADCVEEEPEPSTSSTSNQAIENTDGCVAGNGSKGISKETDSNDTEMEAEKNDTAMETDNNDTSESNTHPIEGSHTISRPSVQVIDRVIHCSDTEKVTLVKFHGEIVLKLNTEDGDFYIMKELARRAFRFQKDDITTKIRALIAIKEQCLKVPFKEIDPSLRPIVVENLKTRSKIKLGEKGPVGIILETNALRLFHEVYKKKYCSNVKCIIERWCGETNDQESIETNEHESIETNEQESIETNEQESVAGSAVRTPDKRRSPREVERNIFKAFEFETSGGIEEDGYDTDSTLPYVNGKPMDRLNDFNDSNITDESICGEKDCTNDPHLEPNNGKDESGVKAHSKVIIDETSDDTVAANVNPTTNQNVINVQSASDSESEESEEREIIHPNIDGEHIIIIDDAQEMAVTDTEQDDQNVCDNDSSRVDADVDGETNTVCDNDLSRVDADDDGETNTVCDNDLSRVDADDDGKTNTVCDKTNEPNGQNTEAQSVKEVTLVNNCDDVPDDDKSSDSGVQEEGKESEIRETDQKLNISTAAEDGDGCPSESSVIVIDDGDNDIEGTSVRTANDSSDNEDVVIVGIDVKPEFVSSENDPERKIKLAKDINHDNVVDITEKLMKKIRFLSDIKRPANKESKLEDEKGKETETSNNLVDLTGSDDEEDETNAARKRDCSFDSGKKLQAEKKSDENGVVTMNGSDIPSVPLDDDMPSSKDKFLLKAEQQLKDCIEKANKAKDIGALTSVYHNLIETEFPLFKWSQSFLDNYEQDIMMEAQRVRSLDTLSLGGDGLSLKSAEKNSIKIPRNPNCSERQDEEAIMDLDNGHSV